MKPKKLRSFMHHVLLYVCIIVLPHITIYSQEEAYAPGVLEQNQEDKQESKNESQAPAEPQQEKPQPIKQEPAEKQEPQDQPIPGKKQAVLSAILPLTGPSGIIGQQLFDGMNLYFNKIKNDPKAGFLVKLHSQDSKSEGPKAIKNAAKLAKDSPIFLSTTGTDAITMLYKDALYKKTLNLFPIEGSETLRGELYKNFVYYRPTHKQELRALVHYVLTKLNKKKIALFYEASDWGEAILNDMQDVLKEFNIKLIEKAAYAQKTVNISDAVTTITKNAPNVIFCIAQDRPAYHFIREILNKGLHNTTFVGLSNLFAIQKTLNQSRGIHIILSSVVPDPVLSQLEIAKEYREDMRKYLPNKNITPFSFEGYINAALAHKFIKQAGLPVGRTKVANTIENTQAFNFKGLSLQLDKTTNTLSHAIWINTGKKEKEWVLAKTR